MAIPGGMMDRVIQARKQQPGYNPNILGPLGQLMTGVGNLIQGRPYGTSFTGVGNIPPSARGESYRRAELRLADAARPGGGGGGGGNAGYSVTPFSFPAAERAYQSDKAAIAQQVAKDPRLSQYERDSAAAVASGDQARMDAVRDQGMAIWAQKNPELAKKVKPGQVGYEAIQRALYPGGAPLPALPAESEAMLNAIAPVDATGIRPDVTPMPGQLPAFGTASDAMYQAVIGNGAAFTPMPQQQAFMTPQLQAQELAEAEKQAMLARIFAQK